MSEIVTVFKVADVPKELSPDYNIRWQTGVGFKAGEHAGTAWPEAWDVSDFRPYWCLSPLGHIGSPCVFCEWRDPRDV